MFPGVYNLFHFIHLHICALLFALFLPYYDGDTRSRPRWLVKTAGDWAQPNLVVVKKSIPVALVILRLQPGVQARRKLYCITFVKKMPDF